MLTLHSPIPGQTISLKTMDALFSNDSFPTWRPHSCDNTPVYAVLDQEVERSEQRVWDWGFSYPIHSIPLDLINDPANGYLVLTTAPFLKVVNTSSVYHQVNDTLIIKASVWPKRLNLGRLLDAKAHDNANVVTSLFCCVCVRARATSRICVPACL